MKKTLLIFFAIVLLVALSACGATDEKGAVIGSVNGVDVYQSEYEHYLADYFDSYYSYYGDNYGLNLADQEIIDTYMPTFMSDLEYYSWQHCVEAALIRQVANDEFGITYDNEFAKAFLPYGEYRTVETDGILSQLTTSDAVQNAASAAAEAAFNADPREYRGTSHILITCDVDDAEAKAAAYEQACQIIQMLQDGASFEDMIAAYSAESTTSYDPIDADGNMIDGSTRFVQEYADGAFSLAKEGDYTLEPVLTQYGYHIIRLNNIISTFEDAKPYMTNLENYFTDLLKQYEDEADVVCNVNFKYYSPDAAEGEAAEDGAAPEDNAEAPSEEAGE